MRIQPWKALPVAAAVIALAAGCGSDDSNDSDEEGSAATTTSSVSGTLTGDYKRKVTEADIDRTEDVRNEAGPGPNHGRLEPGPVMLTLSDGTLKMSDPTGFRIVQDFSATSDGVFRIGAYQHPEKGSFCGPDIPQTASYTWEKSGDVLTLKAEDDACADRDSTLTGDWKAD